MSQTRKDLIVIKAFGKAAEHKLKGLLNLTRSEAAELPQKTVSQVNRISKELIGSYNPVNTETWNLRQKVAV